MVSPSGGVWRGARHLGGDAARARPRSEARDREAGGRPDPFVRRGL
jgi:hypothetical protein